MRGMSNLGVVDKATDQWCGLLLRFSQRAANLCILCVARNYLIVHNGPEAHDADVDVAQALAHV